MNVIMRPYVTDNFLSRQIRSVYHLCCVICQTYIQVSIERHSCLFTSRRLQVKPKFLLTETIHCVIYNLRKLSEVFAMNPSYLLFQCSFSAQLLQQSTSLGVTDTLWKKKSQKICGALLEFLVSGIMSMVCSFCQSIFRKGSKHTHLCFLLWFKSMFHKQFENLDLSEVFTLIHKNCNTCLKVMARNSFYVQGQCFNFP